MASKSSQSETVKEAVSAATRAISGNPELEINFGGMGSSLPNPPNSLKDLTSFRGKADTIACIEKYRDKTISEIYDTNPGYFSWINNAEFPRYTKKVLKELVNTYKLKKKFEN